MKESAKFVEDITVPGMIYALTIRSPAARGTIKGIKYHKLSNSYNLITSQHIPGKNSLADFPVPILAEKKVSYIGQPVALLTGPDESKLMEIASGITVIVEDDERDADSPDCGKSEAIVERAILFGDEGKIPHINTESGDGVQSNAEMENPNIVCGAYRTGIQEHWYADCHGAVVLPPSAKNGETLVIYTASQWPYHVRNSAARVAGMNPGKVKVRMALMTIVLDGKIWYPSLIASQAALAAIISKKPVKLLLSRKEDFLFSPKRTGSEITIQSALGEKGEIKGTSVKVKLDLGADAVFENEMIDQTCLAALGVYKHEAFSIEGVGCRSNIPPQGPMAGFGLAQGFFAAERHISLIADRLGQNPVEWRKDNFIDKTRSLAIGTPRKEASHLEELVDAAAAMSDYHRKWASYELLRSRRKGSKWTFTGEPLRGIGIATAFQGSFFVHGGISGNGNCEVEVTLEKDGSLEIKTSLSSSVNRYPNTWHGMIHEILGVEPSMIRLKNDIPEAPDCGPCTLSRNIGLVTRLVERCCTSIRNQRFRDPLPITVKRSTRNSKIPGWVNGMDISSEAFARSGWGAAVAEIEIDPVTLGPFTRGIWLTVDGGKILSQRRARETLRTGIIQALGWTCREHLHYVNGKIPEEHFLDYDIPSPGELPPISVDFIWNDDADPKGIGELPFCCVPAAYAEAVSQAMDHLFNKIPLDMYDIWNAGKLKHAEVHQ